MPGAAMKLASAGADAPVVDLVQLAAASRFEAKSAPCTDEYGSSRSRRRYAPRRRSACPRFTAGRFAAAIISSTNPMH